VPRIAGIGLVALDVVTDDGSDEVIGEWAGGSTGNLMAILAFLGWDASPIARLDSGEVSAMIKTDLKRWGVNQRWLSLEPTAEAAIYIERLRHDREGAVYHRFERYCPECGARLPGYRPVTIAALEGVLEGIAECDVLFIDRPSPGAVVAAEYARKVGKLVFFEPSARGERRQLESLARAADIVKYSAERLTEEDREVIAEATPSVEIETLGSEGLRFRTRAKWHKLPAPSVDARDTAGAGDWTTAGILHQLRSDLSQSALTADRMRGVLATAQAFGAISCRYAGARGVMEHLTAKRVLEVARQLSKQRGHEIRQRPHNSKAAKSRSQFSCHGCQ
jgi:sugar/nucleoside kinase (ribokinase family)